MWVLLVITIIYGGESPAQFEKKEYASLESCVQARIVIERNPVAHGYCSFEPRKSQ